MFKNVLENVFGRKQKSLPEKVMHSVTHAFGDGHTRSSHGGAKKAGVGIASAAGAATVASGVISALRSKGS